MEMVDIVRKLVGAIEPVGDSCIDEKRYENLKVMTGLVDLLLGDIQSVAAYKDAHQNSLMVAGEHAHNFLQDVRDTD